MAQKQSSQIVFWIGVVAIVVVVGFVIYKTQGGGNPPPSPAAAAPVKKIARVSKTVQRTTQPIEEYTQYYKSAVYEARSEKFSFDLPYYWFAPRKPWPAGIKFPLVVLLHGASGTAPGGKYLIQPDIQLEYPAFIVTPVMPVGVLFAGPETFPGYPKYKKIAHAPRGMFAVMGMVEEFAKTHPVDTSRIYVMGCSEGGVGAFGAVKEYPDIVAAAVAISGGWSADDARSFLRTPMLVLHGAQDKMMPPTLSSGVSEAVRQLGGPLQYIEFPAQGHDCTSPNQYSKIVLNWLFAQKKASVPARAQAPVQVSVPAAPAP